MCVRPLYAELPGALGGQCVLGHRGRLWPCRENPRLQVSLFIALLSTLWQLEKLHSSIYLFLMFYLSCLIYVFFFFFSPQQLLFLFLTHNMTPERMQRLTPPPPLLWETASILSGVVCLSSHCISSSACSNLQWHLSSTFLFLICRHKCGRAAEGDEQCDRIKTIRSWAIKIIKIWG